MRIYSLLSQHPLLCSLIALTFFVIGFALALRGAFTLSPQRSFFRRHKPQRRGRRQRAFLAIPLCVILLMLPLCAVTTGCDNFETTVYKTLAIDQAILIGARQGYIDRTIPRTAKAKQAIEDATRAHNLAKDGLLAYHNVVAAPSTADKVAAAQQALQDLLVPLAKLIAELTAMGAKPVTSVPTTLQPEPAPLPGPAAYARPPLPGPRTALPAFA